MLKSLNERYAAVYNTSPAYHAKKYPDNCDRANCFSIVFQFLGNYSLDDNYRNDRSGSWFLWDDDYVTSTTDYDISRKYKYTVDILAITLLAMVDVGAKTGGCVLTQNSGVAAYSCQLEHDLLSVYDLVKIRFLKAVAQISKIQYHSFIA